ncbi:MAG TPA: winged helix DNA-binding domain-containing protein [Cytophagales bacterium]|nr:winged helix DNA-binding domain-containing protein [Cytophagales bacterium]
MTLKDVIQYRLLNQHIVDTQCKSPYDVVSTLGAVQAQDYLSALWAVGLRLPEVTEAEIEQEIADKKILRTWPMRGTLHFVAAEDARWMLKLLTPRIIAKSAGTYRQGELNDQIFNRSAELFINALQGGKSLTREGMYKVLNDADISTIGQRGMHILGNLAQKGLICLGAREGKQHTFVLLEEWLPKFNVLEGEEALAELAQRYFKSHGPATLNDFVWWTGLKVADAKVALEMAKHNLRQEVIEEKTYWMDCNLVENKDLTTHTCLLPAFDEFFIAYQDRSPSIEPHYFSSVATKNGIFNPIIVRGGKVIGTWKRNFIKGKVNIELFPFTPLSQSITKNLSTRANRYSRFVGKSLLNEKGF